MKLLSWLRRVRARLFPSMFAPNSLIVVTIFSRALKYNIAQFQRRVPYAMIAPVLKSNAYGHGLVGVAKALAHEPIAFFVVDSLYEVKVLRAQGVRANTLIMGYVAPTEIVRNFYKDVACTVTSMAQLRELISVEGNKSKSLSGMARSRKIYIHLKVDTGMHRQGIMPNEVREACALIKSAPYIELQGVCSHFADADGDDETFTRQQISVWRDVLKVVATLCGDIKYVHISATAGVRYAQEYLGNVVRLGRGMYGTDPNLCVSLALQGALEMRTVLSGIKTINAGERVGYNGTFRAEKETTIATFPVGYYEGLDRRLSNKGVCMVRGVACPIVGRVSMNMASIDITTALQRYPDIALGEPVVVISANKSDPNNIEAIAKACDTIPYEIVIHIPQHLRRDVR